MGEGPPVWDSLVQMGAAPNLASAKIRKLSMRDWLDWGVSPRCAWVTPEGAEVLDHAMKELE